MQHRLLSPSGHDIAWYSYEHDPSSPLPLPPPPTSSILLIHGYATYVSAGVDWLASTLSARGIQVFAHDQWSHGDSGGMRGYIPNFADLVMDAVAVSDAARALAPSLSQFVYGESMGGAVAALAAVRHPQQWRGVVLHAPMAGFDQNELPPWWVQAAAQLLVAVVPWAAVTPTRDIQAACFKCPQRAQEARDSTDMRRYQGRPRLATALQFKAAAAEVQAQSAELTAPFLLLHGTADVVTSFAFSQALFEAAASPDKTFLTVEGAAHVLWWEDAGTRRALLAEVAAWVAQRAGVGDAPQLPLARSEVRSLHGGTFRDSEDTASTPWTFVSHGYAGVAVVKGGGEDVPTTGWLW